MEEEQKYLDNLIHDVDLKIKKVLEEKEKYYKLIDDIGIPDKEDSGILRRYKEKYRSCDGKVFDLNKKKDNSHFGRMDLVLKEGNLNESITLYIGEKSYSDINSNILVYDWRSPVCNLYYMSNQDTFQYSGTLYDLELKRQIDIKNRLIENVYDLYARDKDVDVTDLFLLKVLEEKKSRNEFTDIIKTIQENQNNIIRDELTSNAIIQGVAGSGKTVVLLHRISYLLYNHPSLNYKNIVFITPSKIFATKLCEINRILELNQIKMITIEEYYLEKLKQYLYNIKVSKIIVDNFKMKELLNYVYSDAIISDIKEIIKNYVDINIQANFYEYIEAENKKLLKFDWRTLAEKEDVENKIKLNKEYLKKDNVKRIMDILYERLKQQFNLKEKSWLKGGAINRYVGYLLFQIYQIYGFKTNIAYKYMFIDEMQDYSNPELELIYNIEKKPYFNLYGDVNQNIKEYIPKKDISEFTTFIKESLSLSVLNCYYLFENYRNTKQVVSYCNEFLPTTMISMGISSDPIKDMTVSKEKVYDIITNEFTKKQIVILVNDEKLLKSFKELNYEVYTIVEAKGLEFSQVAVIEDNLNLTEKYIAYTRTLDKLFIYHIES